MLSGRPPLKILGPIGCSCISQPIPTYARLPAVAGSPKRRAQRQKEQAEAKLRQPAPTHPELVDIYQGTYTSFEQLRTIMVQRGIVEHGLSPYEVIQRAIDDVTLDYIAVRRLIEKQTGANPKAMANHSLYDHMVSCREAMVRYSTFAIQYDIMNRQLRLSEARVGLLAHTLRSVLSELGISQHVIRQVPQLLIAQLQAETMKGFHNAPRNDSEQPPDYAKANAIAEILHADADVVIEDAEPPQPEPPKVA